MFNFLKNLLGAPSASIKELVANGALVVDVRTPDEYKGGHIEGAVNMPLGTLAKHLNRLQSHGGPIVAYCRSGARSGAAVKEMASYGLEAYNGGGLGEMREVLAS